MKNPLLLRIPRLIVENDKKDSPNKQASESVIQAVLQHNGK